MKPIIKYSLALFAGVAITLAFAGCSHEYSTEVVRREKSMEMVFHINIPGRSAPETRALGDYEENEVKTIEMLLFNPSTKTVVHNPVFANEITSDNSDFRKKSFSVRLPQGVFDVMIFANSRTAFNNIIIQAGDSQEAVLAQLKTQMPATGWISNPSDVSKSYLMPMWGMKEGVSVGQGATITGIWLHRMLSRIDLTVAGSDTQTGNFKLKDIKLYNVQKEGRIAPALSNWNKNGLVNGTFPAGLAAMPSLTGGGTFTSPISYASGIAADQKSCVSEIYIFEAPKATVHADQNAPFLTVKGEFNGVDGWYRIDLADYQSMSYMDVLRNHLYKIQINRVTGTGFPNEEDAKKNRGDNIVVDITLWNEYDLGGTVFDGQHFLSVNPQDINYDEEEHRGETLIIRTDNNSLMSLSNIKVSGSPTNPNAAINWITNLSLSPKSELNGKNLYTLTYDVVENESDERTGYIYVTLGRLTNVVRIEQADGGKTITVSEYLILGHTAQNPAIPKLIVECTKSNGTPDCNLKWTLIVPENNNWLMLSLTNNYADAGKIIHGTGTGEIYVFATSNTLGTNARQEIVTLSGKKGVIGSTMIRQHKDNPPAISANERASCAGAFWRHDQIGERIVQINIGSNRGAWMAMVNFYDNNWNPENEDGVVLALSGSSDPKVGTAEHGNAEDYPMTGFGYGSVVSGSVNSGEDVTFRIGLQKRFTKYSDTPNYTSTFPARYAVIEFWYADLSKMQKIYLRQGEGADYVMRQNDAVNSGGHNSSTRMAARFSPFNLTADILNKQVTINGDAGANPGKFTQFPSQVGAYFQWGLSSSTDKRIAWAPFGEVTWKWGVASSWSSNDESCPSGYRRPKDTDVGASQSNQYGPVAGSEIRQSLWDNPQATDSGGNTPNNTDNVVFGYYADGFYDRNKVVRSGPAGNGHVALGTAKVAFGGRLFFNPNTNASLFFPLAGYRDHNGTLHNNDTSTGYYWTSSTPYANGWSMALHTNGFVLMTAGMKDSGHNIRCVKQ